jgi:hypothetical protein
METTVLKSVAPSKSKLWAGRIITGIVLLFLVFDSVGKLLKPEAVIKATMAFGFSENMITPIGVLLLICTVFYVIPRTSVLGAVFLTGYLGGAVACNLRIDAPLFSNTLFPVYFAILTWAGLYFRSERLQRFVSNKD